MRRQAGSAASAEFRWPRRCARTRSLEACSISCFVRGNPSRQRVPTGPATPTAKPKVRRLRAFVTFSFFPVSGGIACEKAFVGSEGDCDTKPDAPSLHPMLGACDTVHRRGARSTISCSDTISEIDAVCQCAAPKVKDPPSFGRPYARWFRVFQSQESTANLKYAAALPRPSEA